MAETTSTQKKADVAVIEPHRARNQWQDARRRLFRNKAAVIGMVIVGIFVFVAIFASTLAPQNPLPNSNPLTALMDNIAFPNSACNLSNTGSPKPIGTF